MESAAYMVTAASVTAPGAPLILAIGARLTSRKRANATHGGRPGRDGVAHADCGQWVKPLDIWRDRLYCCPLNEPDTNQHADAIDRYNAAFILRLWKRYDLLSAALMLSVGHPRSVDGTPHTIPDWSLFPRTLEAMKDCGSIVSLHEYGMPDNHGTDGEVGQYWVGRFVHLLNYLKGVDPAYADGIPIHITEHGIDLHVGDGKGNRGYLAAGMSPERYLAWLNYSHKYYSNIRRSKRRGFT